MKPVIDSSIYAWETMFNIIPLSILEENEDTLVFNNLCIIINNNLTDVQKRILAIYCHSGSSRKAAQHCQIGYRRIASIVKQSIQIIKSKYYEYYN